MASDARALATRLADLDDAALARILAARGVSPQASWHDFFDAAEGLLDPSSIDRALTRLDRQDLVALAGDAASADGGPGRFGLVDADGAPYAAVAERIAAAATASPAAFAAPSAVPEPTEADP
ncbi:hypothetical protein ACFFIR_14465, partial [Microbacterium arthrosphaerae]